MPEIWSVWRDEHLETLLTEVKAQRRKRQAEIQQQARQKGKTEYFTLQSPRGQGWDERDLQIAQFRASNQEVVSHIGMMSQHINEMNWRISELEKGMKHLKKTKELGGKRVLHHRTEAGKPNGMGLVGRHVVDQGGAQHELEAQGEGVESS